MVTSLGGKFFPLTPRPEDVFIEDIANGLALDCRYNGQGRIDRYYSVAEHSVLMAMYALYKLNWPAIKCLVTLLHDAPEAYYNDVNRAVKQAMRIMSSGVRGRDTASGYDRITDRLEPVIWEAFDIPYVLVERFHDDIKELDCRIVKDEKDVVMPDNQQGWAYDTFAPLGVDIQCWSPERAKEEFLSMFMELRVLIIMHEVLYHEED
tara:strand:- start:2946 stop:3566 length:621 start_codon:yes stop_codon:yes gene_type:complete